MGNPISTSELFDPLGPGTQELAEFTKAIQGLSRNYRNFAKNLEGDGERVKGILASISVQGNQLGQQVAQLDVLNQQERVTMSQLAVEAAKLATEQKRLQIVQEAQVSVQRKVKDATQLAREEYRALQNELRQAFAAGDTARTEKAATAILQAKNATLSLSAALRGSNSELTAARGSYNALDAENKKLIASLKALGGGVAGSSEEAKKLEAQIETNTEALKAFDARILVFNRNVGNYAGGFAGLVAELAKARAAQAGMTAGTAAYANQQNVVRGFQTAAQKSAAQMGLSYEQAGDKIEGVTAAIQPLATNLVRLEKEQDAVALSVGRESEAYRKLGFQIESTKKEIGDVAKASTQAAATSTDFTQQLGFTKEGLLQYGTQLAAGTIGVQALVEGSKAFFALNKEYSADLAAVRKTTGLNADEADRLGESLKDLSTPTTLKGLLTISEIGGQLGESKDGILEFTKAVDIGVQALGNDFAGGAEEIATKLGKVSNVFRKELGPDAAQNILAIGSAVNELGAVGAATAPFLVDVALRTGQASSQFNLGLKNALAYAAVLEETGATAEVAGSSLNRLYSTLGNKTKEAFAIAQKANPSLTLKEFTRLVNTDFNAAIQLFLKGLNAGNASTTEVNKRLATLKLQSGEAKNAILALAQNTDLFAQRQGTANDQLRDATSLAKEAAINNDTLSGSVDKLTNDTKNFFTSGAAGSILKFFVDFARVGYSSTIGNVLHSIGDGYDYIKEKIGLAEKPLVNLADLQAKSVVADYKQIVSQQALLKSYQELGAVTERSGLQENKYAQLREQVQREFGTTDAKLIAERIARRQQETEANKAELQRNLDLFTQAEDEAARRVAGIRTALSQTRRDAGGTPNTREGQELVGKLTTAETALAEAQRKRAEYAAAVAKFQTAANKATGDGADAAGEQEAAELQLDLAGKQLAKNRVSHLQNEITANQKRLDALRKYQGEQGQLFADGQLNSERFAESVAGSEELALQYVRDGAALRIALVGAESAEKLKEADNDRIRQSKKKKITQAELTAIEGEYALRRVQIAEDEKVKTVNIYDDLRASLEVKPLEFKVTQVELGEKAYQSSILASQRVADQETQIAQAQFAQGKIDRQAYEDELLRIRTRAAQRAAQLRVDYPEDNLVIYQRRLEGVRSAETARESDLLGQLARREITQNQFAKRESQNRLRAANEALALDKEFHRATLDSQREANEAAIAEQERAINERLAKIEKIGQFTQEAEGAFFAIKGNFIDADIQRTQAAYDTELKVAGDNAELKTQIQAKYDKQLKKLNYDKAKAERDQAAISVAISTAVAIAKAFAEYVFPYALIPAGIAFAQGALQEAVILSKPLPSYFVGRPDGPAEFANLGERGPELVGKPGSLRVVDKPSVGYLAKGDRVFTAPETKQLLAENELVEGRLFRRTLDTDMDVQTSRLRQGAAQQQAAAQAAQRQSNGQLIEKLEQVRHAVEQQEYYRLNEQDDLVRRSQQGQVQRDNVNRRYRRNARD